MQSQQKEVFPIMSWEMIKMRNKTGNPDWMMAAFSDGRRIFVYGGMYASEQEIVLMANFDGVGIVCVNGHVYVPTDWLMWAFPARRERIMAMDRVIRVGLPKMV